ncbi:hypothetical protein DVH24_019550 [Malus domestica]|uniref:Uncharacterized protein n=1 Tax=Malus domestica TaxID=3750 RepID=A0A498I333_MALDO|nr:hypothetical protein DVH24_019550 [Malus domestica]
MFCHPGVASKILTISEILPFRERNGSYNHLPFISVWFLRRDVKEKEAEIQPSSAANLPNAKNKNSNSLRIVHRESENKNPNISLLIPHCKTKSRKCAVNASSEKKEQVNESSFHDSTKNHRKSQLKCTFSASNFLSGHEILNQITEFCTELKKLAQKGLRKGGPEKGYLEERIKERRPLIV